MKNILFGIVVCLCLASLASANEAGDRVVRAAIVLSEIMDAPDVGIPQDLIDKSVCVAIIPGMKKVGILLGGGYYGRGLMSCRIENGGGEWSAPSMFRLDGGNFGPQIGVQAVDLILVIMNLRGLESLLFTKFTLGGEASVAAGPVGRTASAETDAWMSAKILAYSRSRGLFGGLTVKGGTIRPDKDANHQLYLQPMDARSLLMNKTSPIPKDAQIFLDQLNKMSPEKAVSDRQSPTADR